VLRMVIKALLDTDIGDDIDDAWALALCIRHPRIELMGVTTVRGETRTRAALCRMLLESAGKKETEVVAGSRDGLDGVVDKYRPRYADALGDEEKRLESGRMDAVRFMAGMARKHSGLTLITIGPLTNAARFSLEFPKEFSTLERHVMMCGALIPGRLGPEYNASCDPRATRIALSTRVPKLMVGLDVTLQCPLSDNEIENLLVKNTPLSHKLYRMTRIWQGGKKMAPIMHDPLAVISAVEDGIVRFEPMGILSDEKGKLRPMRGRPNVRFSVSVKPEGLRRRLDELIR